MKVHKSFLIFVAASFMLGIASDTQHNKYIDEHKDKLLKEIKENQKELNEIRWKTTSQEKDSIANFEKYLLMKDWSIRSPVKSPARYSEAFRNPRRMPPKASCISVAD